MDLMDHGNLAASLRHGNLFLDEHTGGVNMVKNLRRHNPSATSAIACVHVVNQLTLYYVLFLSLLGWALM